MGDYNFLYFVKVNPNNIINVINQSKTPFNVIRFREFEFAI